LKAWNDDYILESVILCLSLKVNVIGRYISKLFSKHWHPPINDSMTIKYYVYIS